VVCWSSHQDGDALSIYGQIYNSNGTKRGQEFQVNTYTSSHLYHPSVCGLIGGGFVVLWESYSENSDWSGILAQMFENNCTKRGEEFKANTDTLSSPIIPCISGLSDGGFVICWETESEYTERMGIFGQLFESSGSKRGEEFNINPVGEVNYSPSVCSLSDGIFVICWTSEGHDVDQSGIFAQMFENNGTKFGDELQVNTYTAGSQSLSSVSSISDGGFVVCWGSEGQDGSGFGVFLQIFDQNGNKSSSELQVNTYTNSDQRGAKISDLSDGQFVISWVSYRQDGSGYGVYGQLYDDNGNKRGKEFRINSYVNSDQYLPNVCGLSNGDLVVCWVIYRQDGSGDGIYGKYFIGTPILHSLHAFSLIFPAFDLTSNSTTINFQWQKASPIHVNFPWELTYKLCLDVTEDFSNPEIFSDIYDSTFSVKNLSPGQTYFWKVMAKNIDGDSLWSSETFGFYVSPAAGIEDDLVLKPETFKLYSNYPNPFNPETTIRYSLPADQSSYHVIIKIYDVLGQLAKILKDEQQRPGLYHLIWNGRNAAGQAVPSGVYFCVLEAGSFKATQKMLLVR
jgi:hypothetical protein